MSRSLDQSIVLIGGHLSLITLISLFGDERVTRTGATIDYMNINILWRKSVQVKIDCVTMNISEAYRGDSQSECAVRLIDENEDEALPLKD